MPPSRSFRWILWISIDARRASRVPRGSGWRRGRSSITSVPATTAADKLIQTAQDRWRAVNGPHLVALVRAGATFVNGKLMERPEDQHQPKAA
jgi:hypothetical protein